MDKQATYELMLQQQAGLLDLEKDPIAALANSSALLNETLPGSVFTGFYLYDGEELILGPFQGRVSCTRIRMGKGVCGESAEKRQTIIVDDVKQHANYIACDSAAMSEIVVPIVKGERLIGVIDLDHSQTHAYDATDQHYLEQLAEQLAELY
ncbi:GAF domain-containing protein [Enterococcus canis]|uniref:GAF domain-containing protein n=1 Tax=Enterococcus canis TaxID=214095 RepID=A0A1L8RHJ8_9ENTE|nr:GAF domain-containing protein [Enterococcus canis]OJG19261.1 GAF domain-containing protein [Enterococcus canis]